jgi:1-acyl-sn-glycerol-3-phosphate acyltransferase
VSRPEPFYRFIQWIARTGWARLAGLDIRGLENVPDDGAFMLISNHESNLDPILIQAVCPRRIHAMAKSTQFAVPGVGWLMKKLHSFPVRRYQVDPQSVRVTLRLLRRGEAVGVYIEGERSWDGRLQRPKLGTVRVALKAAVPILPVTISGSYEAWPRWSSRIQFLPITLAFGKPFELPAVRSRAEREAAVPGAARQIMDILAAQLETHPRP